MCLCVCVCAFTSIQKRRQEKEENIFTYLYILHDHSLPSLSRSPPYTPICDMYAYMYACLIFTMYKKLCALFLSFFFFGRHAAVRSWKKNKYKSLEINWLHTLFLAHKLSFLNEWAHCMYRCASSLHFSVGLLPSFFLIVVVRAYVYAYIYM